MREFAEEQMRELRRWIRYAPTPQQRVKALALWNLAKGKTRWEVAEFLGVSRASITAWRQRFAAEGTSGLVIRPGRGRKSRAVLVEVEQYLRQSPRAFGLTQTRWTLRGLAQVVPSLKGFTEMGVWRVLQRAGYRYKRGQPSIHSPDPQYAEKRGPWSMRSGKPSTTQGR